MLQGICLLVGMILFITLKEDLKRTRANETAHLDRRISRRFSLFE